MFNAAPQEVQPDVSAAHCVHDAGPAPRNKVRPDEYSIFTFQITAAILLFSHLIQTENLLTQCLSFTSAKKVGSC